MKTMDEKYMALAIHEAEKGMQHNHGGPFGAVIVKDGHVISRAHNLVLKNNDPTAHAEVMAIRKATHKLHNFDLAGCEIYTTCEPCPMCFAALFWARIEAIYYGCTRHDAAKIGFDDNLIYEILNGEARQLQTRIRPVQREACLPLFKQWQNKHDKQMY